jgi:effector-binding domain-containing protein
LSLSQVTIADVASIPLAVVRRQARGGDLSRIVPEGCGIVWNHLRTSGLKGGRNVALYWDDAIRVEVGVEMPGAFPETVDVVRSATPRCTAACVVLHGPYGQLGAAHRAIHDWCKTNARQLAGPRWELYGHWQEAWNTDPSLIRTDIYYQLAPLGADTH